MYWLYGTPSIFSIDSHGTSSNVSRFTSQDVDNTVTGSHSDSSNPASQQDALYQADKLAQHDTSTPTAPQRSQRFSADFTVDHPVEDATQGYKQKLPEQTICIRSSRSAHQFATLTSTTFTVWQAKPTVAVASLVRSSRSTAHHGLNVDMQVRPDFGYVCLRTDKNILIFYRIIVRNETSIYNHAAAEIGGHARHRSFSGKGKSRGEQEHILGAGEGAGIREVVIGFVSLVKFDQNISTLCALDNEVLVSLSEPAGIRCLKWSEGNEADVASPSALETFPWMTDGTRPAEMTHDRPMNLSCWLTNDGRGYAVLRATRKSATADAPPQPTFQGFNFHTPSSTVGSATKVTINARFSLLAIGCDSGDIFVYTARDYQGHIPLSHRIENPSTSSGALCFLCWSPDGYCLMAGYENGWATWSVYGAPGCSSLSSSCDRDVAQSHDERWLLGARDGFWLGGGAQLLLLGQASESGNDQFCVLDVVRSSVVGCYSAANIARSLFQTSSGFMIYRGYELPELTTTTTEQALWNHVQIPSHYLAYQWPIRSAAVSSDGRYVAVAGRRGLAHYSVYSGRWKTFDNPQIESSFTVRGGMCWFQHVLIVAVETSDSHEIRVYSREAALDDDNIMQREVLPSPVVLISASGDDSLLVYTYENQLIHYVIGVSGTSVRLVQVGQITLRGIIRAPPRVRAMSWILPEEQLEHGDPAQDVSSATILFLVDGKLVLLQPATKEDGDLKYEMRIIAHNVEYHALMRDQQFSKLADTARASMLSPDATPKAMDLVQNDLRDSLWYFDGKAMNVWTDVQDVANFISSDASREVPVPVKVPIDFYPLSVLLNKGIIFGAEPDMTQRRDLSFSLLRFTTRTHLFIPPILRHHLSQFNSPAALYLTHQYSHLPYLSHALEVLLHDVLDDEVDSPPATPELALLPSLLSFLSSSPHFLDIIVQCTRKTEVRSWKTLFAHLPPPTQLFEQALSQGLLKTAGGYLLVLHTLDEEEGDLQDGIERPRTPGRELRAEKEREDQVVRLFTAASEKSDWGLCKELARFLMALDSSGRTLKEAMKRVGLTDGKAQQMAAFKSDRSSQRDGFFG